MNGCFVNHLECALTGERHVGAPPYGYSTAGAPLLVRYDLDAVAGAVDKSMLAERPTGLWRYREFLPYPDRADVVSLGEATTPLVALPAIARRLGGMNLMAKDEGGLPTGSFKARGMAIAITMLKSFGVTDVAVPSAGNAGSAMAAYGARAGMRCSVFVPEDAPEVTNREAALLGAKVYNVPGIIDACGRAMMETMPDDGWFDLSTLKEPYRIEGKKTMGLELAEQGGWRLPDVIFYPTGGGTGLIGMWKAFAELREMGWLEGDLPRMVAVQTTGCAPIIKAFDAGLDEVPEPWENVDTEVHGVRVRKAFGDRLILSALYESGGFAIAVDDREVHDMRIACARADGFHLCPEGAACLAAYAHAINDGRIAKSDRAVIFNSANGLKSPIPVN